MTPSKNQAIQTALTGNWKTAITLNQNLLKENPDDIETLNRLAFAYTIIGKVKDARTTYKKVLALDTQNPIAIKNLKKLSDEQSKEQGKQPTTTLYHIDHIANMFIEESGKTKVVELVNLSDPKRISLFRTGDPLTLSVKRLKIFVLDNVQKYVGMLPDDVGKRLIKFLNGGNHYEAYVKSVDNHNKVSIFIRETKRALKFKNHPSFISGEKSHFLLEKAAGAKAKSNRETEEDYEEDEEESSL